MVRGQEGDPWKGEVKNPDTNGILNETAGSFIDRILLIENMVKQKKNSHRRRHLSLAWNL
jgi:hypothetical protein